MKMTEELKRSKLILRIGRARRLYDAGKNAEEIAAVMREPIALMEKWINNFKIIDEKRRTPNGLLRNSKGLTKTLAFLVRVPTGAHVFDLVFSCPPTGADVGKSAIIANIGVWVLIVVNTLIIFSTELSSHGGNIKLFAAFYTNSHIRPSIHKGCLHFTIVLAKFTRRFMRRERSLPQYQPEPQGPDDLGGNANA